MMTVEQLVKAFQELRRDRGITVDKLQNRPDLLAEFNIETGAEFISFLEETTIPVMNKPKCKAALVALAVGYEPMKDLKTRRLHNAGVQSEEFGDVQQNIRRHEDDGFKEIATLLLDTGRKRIDSRNLYERIDALEMAVRHLSAITKNLIQFAPLSGEDKVMLTARIEKYPGALKRPLRPGEVPLLGEELIILTPTLSNESRPDQD
ncbi:hypothetical protein HAV21_03620 [Paenarthrobacter sp. MSM-2-10-13]|uniref:hypothetical protein n=1 Tax=Paenarthrobacter sp. MSM-2-10-13 TaxID=2717318 RepID=UPI001420D3CD|nr:hypothetical protein [Paenarthrobacter sp. MSM-2-10-13]NHW45987.1 hypothetical protein [Paenarthrobacter sp. MSM-2-10-13]